MEVRFASKPGNIELMVRRKMLNNNVCYAQVGLQVRQELADGLNAPAEAPIAATGNKGSPAKTVASVAILRGLLPDGFFCLRWFFLLCTHGNSIMNKAVI